MTELLRRGGFHLHKWLTNDPEVLATIPVEDRSPRFLELSENRLPTDRALGVTWDLFRFNALRKEPATTKRTVLSEAFSVWDSRELLIPFSIRSKIILQNLNRLKYGWNDELKEADFFFKESELLETEHIPRVLFSRIEPFRETNLHVFCNARQDAFGVCAYLRQEFEDNVVECRLVAGKGLVAPLKA